MPDAEHDDLRVVARRIDAGRPRPTSRCARWRGCCAGRDHLRSGSKHVSFFHSLVYLALLIVAFGLHNPQPETFILGLAHGLLWIGMSLVCLLAVRLRILPLRVAVAVAVLGGIGPFFGSAEFIREQRRRAARRRVSDPPASRAGPRARVLRWWSQRRRRS